MPKITANISNIVRGWGIIILRVACKNGSAYSVMAAFTASTAHIIILAKMASGIKNIRISIAISTRIDTRMIFPTKIGYATL